MSTKPPLIKLRYHTIENTPGEHVTVAEAIDTASGDSVASLTLRMMSMWLVRNGYSWRPGSSGLWERAA